MFLQFLVCLKFKLKILFFFSDFFFFLVKIDQNLVKIKVCLWLPLTSYEALLQLTLMTTNVKDHHQKEKEKKKKHLKRKNIKT